METLLNLKIAGDIGFDVRSADIISQIESFSGAEIRAEIDSYGGDVFEAFSIFNAIKKSGKATECTITSKAMSAATIIMLAFPKVKAEFASVIMIHNPLTCADGHADDIEKRVKMLRDIEAVMIPLYAAKMGKSPEEIKEILAKETSYSALAAYNAGLVDEVLNAPTLAMIFNFAKKIFGFGKVAEAFHSTARLDEQNQKPKAEMKSIKDLIEALAGFAEKIQDEALKGELNSIIEAAKALVPAEPEEQPAQPAEPENSAEPAEPAPAEKPEDIQAKIDEAVSAIRAEYDEKLGKLLAHAEPAKKADVKKIYASMPAGAARRKFREEHKDEL